MNLIKAINIGFLPRVLQASLRSNQVANQHLKEDFFLDLFFTLVFWNKRLKKEERKRDAAMMLILFTCQERPSVEARRDIVLPVELLSVLIVILSK